jgi:hypothetical protein
MLRALGSPVSFLGLLAGFLIAVIVQAYAQAGVARLLGDRAAVRRIGGVRRLLDPFGAVAAVLAGPGWGVTPEIPLRSRGRIAVALLAGPVALLAGPVAVAFVGGVALAGYVLAGGYRPALAGAGVSSVIDGVDLPAAQAFLVSLGLEALGMAVLALVPLPPLPGWRLLELASTGSLGWQRARHYLVDVNLGVLALLVLLILPLGGGHPPLIAILDNVLVSILSAVA